MAMRPVVVGVDGSQESMRAAEWAALAAVRHHAPLRIVSAPPALPPILTTPAVDRELREAALSALSEAVGRVIELAPHLLTETSLLEGQPALAVAASGAGAPMLVVGARGGGGFMGMALGSISRYVAAHAPCPAVVVRTETAAVQRELVVGIRDPREAEQVLGFAFAEAALRRAELVVVHSLYGSAVALGGATGGDQALTLAEAGQSLAAALRVWHDKYPDVQVRQDVVLVHPAKVLACYSARADLVMIGRREEGSAGPAIGGTKHALLNHARGTVVVIPPGG
jgi:nucleotide-binding universal stress UspA family protein